MESSFEDFGGVGVSRQTGKKNKRLTEFLSLSLFRWNEKPHFFISFRKVVVVDDDQINACALPGGKIVINSGLVKRFQHDEAALAFVIAHEVGHVLARHSAEQLTLQGATQLVATVAQGVAMAAAAAAAASGQPGVPMPRGERRERSFFLLFFLGGGFSARALARL